MKIGEKIFVSRGIGISFVIVFFLGLRLYSMASNDTNPETSLESEIALPLDDGGGDDDQVDLMYDEICDFSNEFCEPSLE